MTDARGAQLGGRLAVTGVILFAVVAPLLPIYTWKSDATLLSALLLLAAFYIGWRSGLGPGRSSLDLPALIFLGVAALATVFSVNPFLSFVPSNRTGEGLLVYIGYILALLAVARLGSRQRDVVVTGVVAAAAAIGTVAVGQYFGVDLLYRMGFRTLTQAAFYQMEGARDSGSLAAFFGFRSTSTLGNPIFLGGYTVLLLPLLVALTVQASRQAAWAYAVVSVGIFGAMVASQTRAAWIAAAVAFPVLLATLPRSPRTWRRLGALGAACLLLLVVMLAVRHQALTQRVASLGSADGSLQQKLYVWKHTLPLIAQRPLLGWGFSTLLGRFPDLGSAEYLKVFGFNVMGIDTPHNGVLHLAYSVGLLGLGAFLWLCLVFGRSLRDSLRTAAPHNPRLDGALLAGLLGYFIWLQSAWTQVGPAHLFWLFGGLAAAIGREARAGPA